MRNPKRVIECSGLALEHTHISVKISFNSFMYKEKDFYFVHNLYIVIIYLKQLIYMERIKKRSTQSGVLNSQPHAYYAVTLPLDYGFMIAVHVLKSHLKH